MIDNIIEKMRVETGLSFSKLMVMFLRDNYKYRVTLDEFYNYGFYKDGIDKSTFINKKKNDKLIKKYNDRSLVYKVRNKNILYSILEDHVKRKYFIIKDDNILEFRKFIKRKTRIAVSKIDDYGRDIISLSNIGFDKLFLMLFETNVRLVEDVLIEDKEFNKFKLKSNFTLNYIVFKNRIILRTLKTNRIHYNIDNGKFNNKDIPNFKELDKEIIKISKRLEGLNYVLIEVFPSRNGLEVISINNEVPIIQNKESLYNGKSYYDKIKKYME